MRLQLRDVLVELRPLLRIENPTDRRKPLLATLFHLGPACPHSRRVTTLALGHVAGLSAHAARTALLAELLPAVRA